jgi:outer membrane protein
MQADSAVAVLASIVVVGCTATARLTRPDGDGGWSVERRRTEVAARVDAVNAERPRAAGPLALADALALAERGNRRVAEAERGLVEARERVWQARAQLFPSTVGSGRYTWYSDPQTTGVHLPPGVLPAGVSPVVTVRESRFGVVNGTVTLPLDVSGAIRHALAAAQAGYRGEAARVWATRLGEQVRVIRAYFDVLEAERLRDVTRQTIALDREQLGNAEERFAAGRLTKNELLVVQVALRNAEEQLLQRELAIDQARWELNQAIGLPVDGPTELADVASPPVLPGTEEALRLAHAHNPAVAALLEERQRLDETAQSLARGWLPRVSAGGAIDYSSATIVQPQRIESGFVGFSWDLGTDGRRAAEIVEARAAADRSRIALERELGELEAAVRAAHRGVEERLAAADAARASVAQAEENLRIRREQFGAGRATSDDVLDAEALLAAERATLAGALYQAHARRAELQRLMGLPLDDVVAEAR